MKKVLFRSDASPKIGAGHLMRSVALAQSLHDKGAQVLFMTVPSFDELNRYLRSQSFAVRFMNMSSEHAGSKVDLQGVLEEVQQGYDWVVLDNYYFTTEFQKAVQAASSSVVFINDHEDNSPAADIYVNVSLPEYALIRSELRRMPKKESRGARSVLVTLGGSRQTETLSKIIRALKTLDDFDFHIKVVCGFEHETFSEEGGRHRLEFCPASIENYKLYAWADLAVAAAGGTVWELNYFQIPAVVGALSERQAAFGEALSQAGACEYVGWYSRANEESIAKAVRLAARKKPAALVDGKGAERIIERMKAVPKNV